MIQAGFEILLAYITINKADGNGMPKLKYGRGLGGTL